MKKISLYLSISIAIVFFMVGLSFGYYLTPEYKTTMYSESMGLGTPDRTLDLRYINKMIAHHRGAMLLAEQLKNHTERDEMTKLADEILSSEPKLISELYEWKKNWYNDSRIVRDPVVSNLGNHDESFDLRFLNAMIAHHDDGVSMAKEGYSKSSRKEIVDNALKVSEFLSNGIVSLKTLRNSWYNI